MTTPSSEATPLLLPSSPRQSHEESADRVEIDAQETRRDEKDLLGFWSATALVVGRIVGAGIFSSPGIIVASVGSIGAALTCWIIGAVAAFAGVSVELSLPLSVSLLTVMFLQLFVWLEWAVHYPRNGGDKIYLERAYPSPVGLAAYLFAARAILLGATPSACVIFSSNIQKVFEVDSSPAIQKALGIALLT